MELCYVQFIAQTAETTVKPGKECPVFRCIIMKVSVDSIDIMNSIIHDVYG